MIPSLAVLLLIPGVEGFSRCPFPTSRRNSVRPSASLTHPSVLKRKRSRPCANLRMALEIPLEKTREGPVSNFTATNSNYAYKDEDISNRTQDLDGRNNIISTSGLADLSSAANDNEDDLGGKELKKQPSVSKEDSERELKAPGISKIIKFAIPATGVWLCGPLLSLIDTAAVGLLAGTSHQAALSPAVAVTDYSALLLAFLYAATTNLVAASKSKPSASETFKHAGDTVEAAPPQQTLLSSLQLSLFVGAGLGTALFALSKVLVKSLIGHGDIDPAVLLPAVRYVQIRALGMPAAAVLGSAQAACLGLKDIRSPLMVLMSAAAINLLGDLTFVGSKFSLFHGAAGAAWATVFSQYAAVAFFLHWLKTKPGSSAGTLVGKKLRQARSFVVRKSTEETDIAIPPTRGSSFRQFSRSVLEKKRANKRATKDTFSTRGYLAEGNFRKRDILSLPPKKDASKFLSYVIPVTTTSVGRVSLFVTMAHVVSNCMGTVGMAGQQIVLALFEALCPLADSMSLTAQSFVPALHEGAHESEENAAEMTKTTKQFFLAGGIFSAAIVSLVSCIPLISRFFTNDAMVVAQVNSIAPYLAGVFAMHGVIMASEGVLLGRRDLGFLGRMYAIYFAVVPALMLRAKRAHQLGLANMSLQTVWQIFLAYQVSRVTLWVGRALWLAKGRTSAKVDSPIATENSTNNEGTTSQDWYGLTPSDEAVLFSN